MPVARRWFTGHEAWLVGAALGYLVSSLAASVLLRFELATPSAVLAISVVVLALALRFMGAGRIETSELPWLTVTWLVVMLIVVVPFSRVGASVADGVAYRAYFSADLMTHLSVVAELQKGGFPLHNPFYQGAGLGYYWLFFTLPAALGVWLGNQTALLATYLAGGLLFAGLLYAAARRFDLAPARAFLAASVMMGAAGYEGLLALARSESWMNINVDAFSRWVLELISLDGLHRGLLYTPQHLFSYSLLVILILIVHNGEPRRVSAAVFCGVLLGGMAGTSIVTAMLAGPWLVLMLWRRRHGVPFLAMATASTVTSLGFLAWYVNLGFFGEAGGALTLRSPKLLELPSILLIDCGALGLLAWRHMQREIELVLLAALALVAVLFLDLRGYEGVWMAWRAGSVLLVALGLVAARALSGPLSLTHAIILAPAVLTVSLDVYNAADVTNRNPSPGGFPWTTVVPRAEREALDWIRRETPPDAVVQWDVRARELGEWALVPALGERRMAVGFPIFLLDLQKYRQRERRHARPIFNSGDAAEAHRKARELGIDYLVIGAAELRVRGERTRPLFEAEDRFRTVFESDGVAVLAVLAP